ncbi:MAG: GNAT family protein [Verrucomicrobiota bacterium]
MITLERERVSDWLRDRIVKPRIDAWMGQWVAMGYEQDGVLVGAVVFDSFTPHECAMHVALDGRVPRAVVREVFRYPYVTAGLNRITVSVAESNALSRRLIERWGFRLEGKKRLGCGDEDELIYGLLRQECRLHV